MTLNDKDRLQNPFGYQNPFDYQEFKALRVNAVFLPVESKIRVSKTLHTPKDSYYQLMQTTVFIEHNSSTQTYNTIGFYIKKSPKPKPVFCVLLYL